MRRKEKWLTTNNVEVLALVVCELAQITQDGKISLMGIFSRLTANRVPIRIPRFFMVGMLKGIPLSEHNVGFEMIGPSKQKAIQQYQARMRLGLDGRANVINELTNTTLLEYGNYYVRIYVDGVKVGETEFLVEAINTLNLSKSSSTIPN